MSFSKTSLQLKLKIPPERIFCVLTKYFSKKEIDNFYPIKELTKTKEIGPMEEYAAELKFQDPFRRTGKILKNDMKLLGYKVKNFFGYEAEMSHDLQAQFFPTHTDVLIIGGGATGSSIAYWLKQRAPHAMHVTIIEHEADKSTYLPASGLKNQFSLPENIAMSLYGAEFLRSMGKHLFIEGMPLPDVNFHPCGHLQLASNKDADILKERYDILHKMGARNILLSPEELIKKFPWLSTDNVELGCLGLEYEGWFSSWKLLNAFKQKSINLGAEYIQGNVVGFELRNQPHIIAPSKDGKYDQLERVIVKLTNGEIQAIKFGYCIIAAEDQSGVIATMARIGQGDGLLSVSLPIKQKKGHVFCYDCPEGPGFDTPSVSDISGAYFMKQVLTDTFMAGMSFLPDDEPSADLIELLPDDEPSADLIEQNIKHSLAKRVRGFEKLQLKSTTPYFYEFNSMDDNGIIGPHPYYHNLLIVAGFCENSFQHAPAVGRALMELLLDGEYKTINLSRFGFDRFCLQEPLYDKMVELQK